MQHLTVQMVDRASCETLVEQGDPFSQLAGYPGQIISVYGNNTVGRLRLQQAASRIYTKTLERGQ